MSQLDFSNAAYEGIDLIPNNTLVHLRINDLERKQSKNTGNNMLVLQKLTVTDGKYSGRYVKDCYLVQDGFDKNGNPNSAVYMSRIRAILDVARNGVPEAERYKFATDQDLYGVLLGGVFAARIGVELDNQGNDGNVIKEFLSPHPESRNKGKYQKLMEDIGVEKPISPAIDDEIPF